MIKNLRKHIVMVITLPLLIILFLVIAAYNVSNVTYVLSDEQNALENCVASVSSNSDEFDSYLNMSLQDLSKIRDSGDLADSEIRYILYGIISTDICIAKVDAGGEIISRSGGLRGVQHIDGYIFKLMRSGKSSGWSPRAIFEVADKGDYQYYIMLSTKDWISEILKVLLISLIGFLLAAIALSAVAMYISRKITRPVEEAITRQNRFIADASHELKTPVSVINANISVLEREYGENKWMTYIKEEGHRMTQLINQLLNLSRLDFEAGQKDRKQAGAEAFEVNEALTEAALTFDSIAFEKNTVIELYLGKEFTSVSSRSDFKEIVAILLDNAIKHSREGSEISITSRKTFGNSLKGSREGLQIAIANTGSTIAPEDLPYIFDRFYKSSHSKDGGENSFGLGLSIARSLAGKNGYGLDVSSINDMTTFTISMNR